LPLSLAQRTSVAAHRDLPHANPLSPAQFDALVQAIAARRPREVLDIGCGWGSFALALAQACDTRVLAIDINADFLERGRQQAAGRPLLGTIDFRELPAEALAGQRFDAVVCIGAAQAFGKPPEALARCADLLTPGGTLLFADGVWTTEPPQDFLDFLGTDRSTYWLQSDAEAAFATAGLRIERQEVTSASSWQAYEDAIHRGRLRFADTLEAAEATEVRQRTASWTSSWERWGRHCLGFVGVVATRAGDPPRDTR
jgi:cyclopropane fatty-acyl-phospholipid synthase-like methyltransferase